MKKISIVYHSGYGHTKIQAESVLRGLQSVNGVEVKLVTSEDATKNLSLLDDADCIVFGCPTYMGGPSAQFKQFVDAASSVWFKQGWKDKLAAGFTNSGGLSGDKQSTLMQLLVNAMQHSMIWIGTGFLNGADKTLGTDLELNRLGGYLGAMSQSPQGSTEPIKADLATAERFGKRIAEVVVAWGK